MSIVLQLRFGLTPLKKGLVILNEGLHACIIKPLHQWSCRQNEERSYKSKVHRATGPDSSLIIVMW